jgi:hypothetical protein
MKSDMGFPAEECAQNGRRNRQYDTFHKESLVWICRNCRGGSILSRSRHHMDEHAATWSMPDSEGSVIGISTPTGRTPMAESKNPRSPEKNTGFLYSCVSGTGIELCFGTRMSAKARLFAVQRYR